MTFQPLFLFFIASFGISLALFFSLVLFRWERKPPYSNQILALLLFFLSLRIGKSVFYNFIEIPFIIKHIGLACNLTVGPFLLLYGRSLRQTQFTIRKQHFVHFLPALLYLPFFQINLYTSLHEWENVSYSFVLLQSFIYVFWCIWIWYRKLDHQESKARWYISLTLGLTLMWAIYLLIFIEVIPIYLAGAFSFTLLIIILAYIGINRKEVFTSIFFKKYQSSNLSEEEGHLIVEKVKTLMLEEQVYLKTKPTLNTIASTLGTNSKTLSLAINKHTGRNFSYFINTYRIAYAKQLFSDPVFKDEKIISIAFKSGFNSLSSFNAVFKLHTLMTPSEFRDQHFEEIDL